MIDIDLAAMWFEQQQPGLGDDFIAQVRATIARIENMSQMYAPVSRPPRGRDVREALLHQFVLRLLYEVTATEVVILSVSNARSNRQTWRQRLDPHP